jgi:hypothetical protein
MPNPELGLSHPSLNSFWVARQRRAWLIGSRLRGCLDGAGGVLIRKNPPFCAGHQRSASGGLVYCAAEIDAGAIMKNADQTMYQAKPAGRNQIRLDDGLPAALPVLNEAPTPPCRR